MTSLSSLLLYAGDAVLAVKVEYYPAGCLPDSPCPDPPKQDQQRDQTSAGAATTVMMISRLWKNYTSTKVGECSIPYRYAGAPWQ
jgi:hypothetical protein